jgi:hypothetical protein
MFKLQEEEYLCNLDCEFVNQYKTYSHSDNIKIISLQKSENLLR